MSKCLAVNSTASRHKARMILSSAFEVKAAAGKPAFRRQPGGRYRRAEPVVVGTGNRRCARTPAHGDAKALPPHCALFPFFGASLRKCQMPLPPLVLASTSPYRRELLARLGIPFDTASPAVDEAPLPGESPTASALRLSEAKARAVAADHPGSLIIGSDQVAFLDGEVFGKPGNHANAVRQLQRLQGRSVNFFTGLCLLNTHTGHAQVRGVPTMVTFRQLTDRQIENYLLREQPYNCAGSARSEALGIALIARIDGEDPNALIGLPLIALCELLQQERFEIL